MNKFQRLKEYLKKPEKRMVAPEGKATAELDASKNPLEFLKKNKNMSIKGKKGIAF